MFFNSNACYMFTEVNQQSDIAKQMKPQTIGETFEALCTENVEIVLGKEAEKKIAAISLSNNTVQRRIADMSVDIKEQIIDEIRSAPFGLFSWMNQLMWNPVLSYWLLSDMFMQEPSRKSAVLSQLCSSKQST